MTIKLVIKNEKQDTSLAAKTLILDDLLITMGSSQTATVLLDDPEIALEQAVIINENGNPLFINRNRGTTLNGIKLGRGLQHNLKTGDEIVIGAFKITVNLRNGMEPETISLNETQTAAPHLLEEKLPDSTPRDFYAADDKDDVRSFADILSSLRKEEDQYYFQITEPDGLKRRLIVENEEIILGWSGAYNIFSSSREISIDQPQAAVRKDWGGVTVYPNGEEAILLNNTLLEAGAQLRNGDKLVFSRRAAAENAAQSVTLVFCEPAALIELNAILPQELLTNALEVSKTGEIKVEAEPQPLAEVSVSENVKNTAPKIEKVTSRRYFGYFNFIEVFIMFAATISTAVLTFLLLQIL